MRGRSRRAAMVATILMVLLGLVTAACGGSRPAKQLIEDLAGERLSILGAQIYDKSYDSSVELVAKTKNIQVIQLTPA